MDDCGQLEGQKRGTSASLAWQGSKLDGPELDYVQGHNALAISGYGVGGMWKILQDVPYSADSGLVAVAIPATCFQWQNSVTSWTLAMAEPKVTVGFGAAWMDFS